MDRDRRLLVHIGTEKTGSTSIQAALSRAETSGSLRPVRYPIIDGAGNHSALANLYMPRERMTLHSRTRYAWEQIFPGDLCVRRFSDVPDFDVVSDFAQLTEEFLGVEFVRPELRLNATVSAEGMEILHRYQSRFGTPGVIAPDAIRLVKSLQRNTAWLPHTRPMLRPEVAAAIRANHRDDAAFIHDRYGVDLLPGDDGDSDDPSPTSYDVSRIGDVLQSVDHDRMIEMLLEICHLGLSGRESAPRGLTARIASRWSRGHRKRATD